VKHWPSVKKDAATRELIDLEKRLKLDVSQRCAARQFVTSSCSKRGIELSAPATEWVVEYLLEWAESFEVPSE
jgi:hypothetical protein